MEGSEGGKANKGCTLQLIMADWRFSLSQEFLRKCRIYLRIMKLGICPGLYPLVAEGCPQGHYENQPPKWPQ